LILNDCAYLKNALFYLFVTFLKCKENDISFYFELKPMYSVINSAV